MNLNTMPGFGDEATWGGRSPEEPDTDPRITELAEEIADDLFDGTGGYRFEGRVIDQDLMHFETLEKISGEELSKLGDGDALHAYLGIARMKLCREWAEKIAEARIDDMDKETEMDAALDRAELAAGGY